MPQSEYYEIRIEGHIGNRWSEWFAGLTLSYPQNGETLLCGRLPDQAALHGILMKIRDLHLVLISVNRIEESTC